jgi:hypothetical protein
MCNQRTLERWAAHWRDGAAIVIQRAIQWIAQMYGTRAVPVWPEPEQPLWHHWRPLWQGVVQMSDLFHPLMKRDTCGLLLVG